MSEDRITEKIYCYDHPSAYNNGNNDALLAAIMSGKRHDADPMAAMAMMNGGMNNQWNNPFIYLVWMMFAQRMWGNGFGFGGGQGVQDVETQNQLQAIRSQLQDNQNSNLIMDAIKGNDFAISQLAQNVNCDFKALQGAVCDVRGGIEKLSGQVGFSAERVINAVNMGDCNVIQAVKDCCCQTQQNLLRFQGDMQLQMCQQTNTLQQGQDFINRSIERGFAASSFETQRQTCDIINAGNANTQRIIDTLNGHWNDENNRKIQDLKFELSQERQNNFLASKIAALNGGNCGCGCGCNNGCSSL